MPRSSSATGEALADVGLGYLSLGQPLTALSGGERRRLELATHMAEKGGVYVLDEPTAGLHLADVKLLLDRLVGSGKSRCQFAPGDSQAARVSARTLLATACEKGNYQYSNIT